VTDENPAPRDVPPPCDPAASDAGPDAVRAALNRARSAASAKGLRPGAPRSSSADRRRARIDAERRSGARPDARDPQPVALNIDRLVAERGWTEPVAVGGAIGRWGTVVGPDLSAHCEPETFEDGVLTVRAESTAWATQIRLLVPSVMRRLDEELGRGTITKIIVRGPSGPSWRKGPRVAPGSRGPRDTYG
jgi:predicted nucleic acid-binding Zn ribbon protein